MVLNGQTDEVRRGHILAVLAFAEPQVVAPVLPGAHTIVGHGSEWEVLFGGSRLDLEQAAGNQGTNPQPGRDSGCAKVLHDSRFCGLLCVPAVPG